MTQEECGGVAFALGENEICEANRCWMMFEAYKFLCDGMSECVKLFCTLQLLFVCQFAFSFAFYTRQIFRMRGREGWGWWINKSLLRFLFQRKFNFKVTLADERNQISAKNVACHVKFIFIKKPLCRLCSVCIELFLWFVLVNSHYFDIIHVLWCRKYFIYWIFVLIFFWQTKIYK